MFAARGLQGRSFRTLYRLLSSNPHKDGLLLLRDFHPKCFIDDTKAELTTSMRSNFVSCSRLDFRFENVRSMSTARGRSMRSKVEKRMQREAGKTQREIRRAKKLRLKLMTEEERLIYQLRRAKKKVALLLQKLKKYELPELPPPKHDPELLTPEQLQAYKKIGFRNRNYAPIGIRGVFGGVVQNMHLHWKFHETVQVCCDNFPKERIKEMAIMLARLSGGIVVNIHNVKTIIMFRGRNYRQPKNLIPMNTLTKRKALFKARFEQALESQKLNIKKIEQELRRKGINPEDPVAMASIRRVASTFFNAIDKQEGSPYVFRGGEEESKPEPERRRCLQISEPQDDSDQEELDKFIAEIEDAADKEWAAEEAAEKEDFDRIRYWNREESSGRYGRDERTGDRLSENETRGGGFRDRKDTGRRSQRAFDSDDEDVSEASSDDGGWESNDKYGADIDSAKDASDYDRNQRRYGTRTERGKEERNRGAGHGKGIKRDVRSRSRMEEQEGESASEEALSDLDSAMWESETEEEQNLKANRPSVADHRGTDSEDDYNPFSRFEKVNTSSRNHASNSQRKSPREMREPRMNLREWDVDEEEDDDDDVDDSGLSALKAAEDDYLGVARESGYTRKDVNAFYDERNTARKHADEHWDSD